MDSVLAIVLSIVAIVVSLGGVIVDRRGGHGQLFRDALIDVYSDDLRRDRGALYHLSTKDFNEWNAADHQAAARVAVFFDRMGLLVRARYLPEGDFLAKWGQIIERCYAVCRAMIEARRYDEGIPDHFVHFEWLARRAILQSRKTPWWKSKSWQRMCQKTDSDLRSVEILGVAPAEE